jgi:hypothetical protein
MYQIVVQAPAVGPGDWPIIISTGGLTVTPNVFITAGASQ